MNAYSDPLGERVDVRYTNAKCAAFVPRTPGFYKIYIGNYQGPIFGSPFFVNIHEDKDLGIHATQKSDKTFIETSGIRDTVINEESKFLIRNKDEDIDVQITGISKP